jgi:hypothetical protein
LRFLLVRLLTIGTIGENAVPFPRSEYGEVAYQVGVIDEPAQEKHQGHLPLRPKASGGKRSSDGNALMWFEITRDLAICAVFALLVWAPLGRWLMLHIGNDKLDANQSLAVAVGSGIWSLLILSLGTAGLLYRGVLPAAATAIFLALRLHRHIIPPIPKEVSEAEMFDRLASKLMWLVGTIFVVMVTGSALAPEQAFDSLNVHLPYARDAALSHRTFFDPNNWSSAMPALPLMNYITAFLASGMRLAKLFNLLCFMVCGWLAGTYARRWWGRKAGAAAALLFLSCPVALYEATTALIDLPLVMFSAAAVLSLLEWTRSGELGRLRLSAVALGFALGCKYHAAFWIVPSALLILFHSLRVRRHALKPTLAILAQYLAIVFVLLLPWLFRTWHYTGNPVFPAANRFFKSPYFTLQMEAAAKAAYANEGVGASFLELARLPWTVTVHPGPFRGTLGILFFVGAALALARRVPRPAGYGLAIAAFYFYAWALSAQEIRYLLPLAPLLSVIAAAGFVGIREDSRAGEGRARHWLRSAWGFAGVAAVILGSILSLPCFYPGIVREWTYWHSYQSPVAFLLGRQTAEDFVKRDVPSIYVHNYSNAHLGKTDRILLLNDSARFYSRVPTLYSFTVEAEGFLLQDTEEGLMSGLEKSGITHVLLNYNGITPMPGVAPRRGAYFFLDKRFRERHLEPLFSQNNVVLYRVRRNTEAS